MTLQNDLDRKTPRKLCLLVMLGWAKCAPCAGSACTIWPPLLVDVIPRCDRNRQCYSQSSCLLRRYVAREFLLLLRLACPSIKRRAPSTTHEYSQELQVGQKIEWLGFHSATGSDVDVETWGCGKHHIQKSNERMLSTTMAAETLRFLSLIFWYQFLRKITDG